MTALSRHIFAVGGRALAFRTGRSGCLAMLPALAVLWLVALAGDLGAVPVTSFYQAAILDQSPLAYWRLNETSGTTALDASGNGNNATYTVLPTLGAPGPQPPAFIGFEENNFSPAFNGTSDQRANAVLTGLGFDYSISMWFRNDRPIDAQAVTGYMSSRSNTTGSGSDLAADNLGIWGTAGGGGNAGKLILYNGSSVLTGATVIADNDWHHVAYTRNGSTAAIYLNGQLEISGTLAATFTNPNGTITFGTRSDFFADWLGNLDEVAVWDRALTGEEIGMQFLASQQTFPPPIIPEPTTALLLAPLGLLLLARRSRRRAGQVS